MENGLMLLDRKLKVFLNGVCWWGKVMGDESSERFR